MRQQPHATMEPRIRRWHTHTHTHTNAHVHSLPTLTSKTLPEVPLRARVCVRAADMHSTHAVDSRGGSTRGHEDTLCVTQPIDPGKAQQAASQQEPAGATTWRLTHTHTHAHAHLKSTRRPGMQARLWFTTWDAITPCHTNTAAAGHTVVLLAPRWRMLSGAGAKHRRSPPQSDNNTAHQAPKEADTQLSAAFLRGGWRMRAALELRQVRASACSRRWCMRARARVRPHTSRVCAIECQTGWNQAANHATGHGVHSCSAHPSGNRSAQHHKRRRVRRRHMHGRNTHMHTQAKRQADHRAHRQMPKPGPRLASPRPA
jgi:hypothetical protein